VGTRSYHKQPGHNRDDKPPSDHGDDNSDPNDEDDEPSDGSVVALHLFRVGLLISMLVFEAFGTRSEQKRSVIVFILFDFAETSN
jgi:hypothetical protein